MLVQLVCLDRRYQRMNCFNIREIQTILKSKYSPNTTDNADVHFSLNDTAVGLRYSLSDLTYIDTYLLTFYKNLIVNDPRYKALHRILYTPMGELDSVKYVMSKASFMGEVLNVMYEDKTLDVRHMIMPYEPTLGPSYLISLFVPSVSTGSLSLPTFNLTNVGSFSVTPDFSLGNAKLYLFALSNLVQNALSTWADFITYSFNSFLGAPNSFLGLTNRLFDLALSLVNPSTASLSFNLNIMNYLPLFLQKSLSPLSYTITDKAEPTSGYATTTPNTTSFSNQVETALQENVSDSRFMRSMNSVFKYDFKVGNYMPDDVKQMNPHLFMTIKDVTTGIKKSS